MHSLLDRGTILTGLADEVRPLLPNLGGALSDLCSGLNPALAAEQALDTAFTIRAAAEMLELADLAEAAELVERLVPVLYGSPLELRREGRPAVRLLLAAIEKATDALTAGLPATPPELAAGRVVVEKLVGARERGDAAARRPVLDLDAMLATLPTGGDGAELGRPSATNGHEAVTNGHHDVFAFGLPSEARTEPGPDDAETSSASAAAEVPTADQSVVWLDDEQDEDEDEDDLDVETDEDAEADLDDEVGDDWDEADQEDETDAADTARLLAASADYPFEAEIDGPSTGVDSPEAGPWSAPAAAAQTASPVTNGHDQAPYVAPPGGWASSLSRMFRSLLGEPATPPPPPSTPVWEPAPRPVDRDEPAAEPIIQDVAAESPAVEPIDALPAAEPVDLDDLDGFEPRFPWELDDDPPSLAASDAEPVFDAAADAPSFEAVDAGAIPPLPSPAPTLPPENLTQTMSAPWFQEPAQPDEPTAWDTGQETAATDLAADDGTTMVRDAASATNSDDAFTMSTDDAPAASLPDMRHAPVGAGFPRPEEGAETGPLHETTPLAQDETAEAWDDPTPSSFPDLDLDIDPEILEVFQLEAEELLAALRDGISRVAADHGDVAAATETRRVAHTMKGAANVVGFTRIGAVCACVEDLLDTLHETGQPLGPVGVAFLQAAISTLEALSAAPADAGLAATAETLTRSGRGLVERYAQAAPAPAVEVAEPTDCQPIEAVESGEPFKVVEVELVVGEPAQAAQLDATTYTNGAFHDEPAENEDDLGLNLALQPEGDVDAAELAAWNEAVRAFLADAEVAEAEATAPAAVDPALPLVAAKPVTADAGATDLHARELLSIFAAEAEEHLGRLSAAALALDRAPHDASALADARRALHTLKGAAASLGLDSIAAVCHQAESSLDDETAAGSAWVLFDATETIEALLAPDAAAEVVPSAPSTADQPADLDELPLAELLDELPLAAPGEAPVAPPAADEPAGADEPAASGLRVELARIDDLLNVVGDLAMNRGGLEQRLARLLRSTEELRLTVARLRRVSHYLEDRYEVAELLRAHPDEGRFGDFDELEMDRYTELHRISREVAELSADTETTGEELEAAVKDLDGLISRQRTVTGELQDRLMAIRMVPLASLQTRLERTVRGVALRQAKLVDFALEGGATELDNVVLEQLGEALLHLVRNAVDHGLELPEDRLRAGKPADGRVTIRAAREGGEVVLRIADDGAGIDADRLREKAVLAGALQPDVELDRSELLELVFVQGLSTRAETTDISGRGVGLDVVKAVVTRLKGSVSVSSQPGQGTTFVIRLPVVMAVLPAMFVRVGGQAYAIPMAAVERVLKTETTPAAQPGRAPTIEVDDEALPLVDLGVSLGQAPTVRPGEPCPLVVLRAGEQRVAVAVDHLVGQQEVVVKGLGPHLRSVRGVLGVTIQGNGQLVLVLNTADLLVGRTLAARPDRQAPPVPRTPALPSLARKALVVDDSLSVRKVLARVLERDGWEVRQARDGVNALEVLQGFQPDAVLLDVEMPRMDGFELAGILRDVPDYGRPPIVMITSRAGDKHRKRGDELGVAAYLVKPYQERELLETLAAAARTPSV